MTRPQHPQQERKPVKLGPGQWLMIWTAIFATLFYPVLGPWIAQSEAVPTFFRLVGNAFALWCVWREAGRW